MALRHRTGLVSMLAAPLVALLVVGVAGVASASAPVAGVVVSGLAGRQLKIGVATAPVTFATDGTGDAPVKFDYWINGGRHKTVKAGKSGSAIVYLTFTTHQNGLSVQGVGADGTLGNVTFDYYFATGVLPAADQDSTGDGVPDLLTVGDQAGLGSGLWLAPGKPAGASTGRVKTPAVNIAQNVTGFAPSYFDGAQVITGDFLGDNLQDVMVYFVNGVHAGAGLVLPGTGDGSAESGVGGRNASLDYFTDINGDYPVDLANAYNSAGTNGVEPDLIGITGSDVDGYHLTYYSENGVFLSAIGALTANLTPTGGVDWQNWQLFSAKVPSGTAIYLWNSTTGALYLWEAVTFTDNGDFTGSISYTQYEIARKWSVGAAFSTVAAVDFTGDGIPDLWTVTPAGVARAYVVSDLSTTARAQINAKAPQNLTE